MPNLTEGREPGRTLDAMIAERVFGWTACDPREESGRWEFSDPPEPMTFIGIGFSPEFSRRIPIPEFSTSIASAWLVVERMREQVAVDSDVWPRWMAAAPNVILMRASEAAHAICLAALDALDASSPAKAAVPESDSSAGSSGTPNRSERE